VASSGSVDFTVNRNEIIKAALRLVNKDGGLGEEPTTSEVNDSAQTLNMIVKQIPGFTSGVKTWARKTGYVFLQKDQVRYTLPGDHSTSAFIATAISAAESPGQTTLSVNDIAGISAADNIGIELDDGTIQWTTVSATPVSGTVSISPATLNNSASAGNSVYVYTTPMRRPLEILTQKLIDRNGDEIGVRQMNLQQYQATPNKHLPGTPQRIYYEQHVDNGLLFLDFAPDDVSRYLSIVFLSAIEDFDAATDTPDFPQEWLRPLKNMLAYDLWPEYRTGERPGWLKDDRAEAIAMAERFVPEEDIGGFFESMR
jgi:hypothetical protein